MARLKNNIPMRGSKGAFGKQVVYKTNKKGLTYATAPADRSNVKSSKEQTKSRKKFAKAVKFAQAVKNDPEKAAGIVVEEHRSLYHTALGLFMTSEKRETLAAGLTDIYTDKYLSTLKLNARQIKAVRYIRQKSLLTNGKYMKINKTSKPTATRDLQDLVARKILLPTGAKGAGAAYTLMGSPGTSE